MQFLSPEIASIYVTFKRKTKQNKSLLMPLFRSSVLGYWYPIEQIGDVKGEELQALGNTYSPCEL